MSLASRGTRLSFSLIVDDRDIRVKQDDTRARHASGWLAEFDFLPIISANSLARTGSRSAADPALCANRGQPESGSGPSVGNCARPTSSPRRIGTREEEGELYIAPPPPLPCPLWQVHVRTTCPDTCAWCFNFGPEMERETCVPFPFPSS